ncbi:MAG: hypothetical protein JSS96_15880, partial [Bacteroidetes bacterium]|nr:hypothetical protein [Bacteroidota bacterium]
MKRIFTIVTVLMSWQYVGAQTVLFKQDFDGFAGYNITGWHHSFTGAVPWFAGLPYEVGDCMSPLMARTKGTNKVACIPDCGTFNYDNSNVFMYSPPIHFATVHGAWLRYDSYFRKYTHAASIESASVEVSTDSGKTWTIVQDVPANPSIAKFITYYIDLSAYDFAPDVWVGFRYSDDSASSSMCGWAIDNVQVFIPENKDIALVQMTPDDSLLSYAVENTGIMHSGTVYNAGLDTIRSFAVKYQQGGGAIRTATFSGLSIPRFNTYTFTHPYPDTVSGIGTYNVSMWVEATGDTNPANDTQTTTIRGAYFNPVKKLAIEEGTGTWNPNCPQGWVYMNQLATSDVDACQISVHDNDIMADTSYAEYLYYLHYDYVPYMLIDRQKIEVDSFFDVVNVQKHHFGFADINLDPILDGNTLTLNAHVKPAIDIDGHFRLIMVITQDDVTGPSPYYDQLNNYAGGGRGPMGGFESKAARVPASDMYYNFVARSISSFDGSSDTLPHALIHNDVYDHIFTTKLDPSWHKLRAIVMLLRNDDTTVLNANKTEWYLNIKTPDVAS